VRACYVQAETKQRRGVMPNVIFLGQPLAIRKVSWAETAGKFQSLHVGHPLRA
jgi:hypothetical protein